MKDKTTEFKFVFSLISFFLISCGGNCESLNQNFTTYKNAIDIVRNTDFSFEEKKETESSWIDFIEYYSCDEITGFLIINSKKGKSYIYDNVPFNVWFEFKNAESFGGFYNQNIKSKYFLRLN